MYYLSHPFQLIYVVGRNQINQKNNQAKWKA